MLKLKIESLLTCSAIAFVCLVGSSANASEAIKSSNEDEVFNQLQQYSSETNGNSINQVTGVNQLRDVAPTDWAYEALQSLVERYGCVAGYPNGTFRGNKSLSRYEFAAGLNACMNQMERLIASSQSVVRDDLDKLQRLSQEFQTELAALGTRVDNLEGRTKFLEDHQFSTTTKLNGEVIFALTDSFGDNDSTQTTLGDRYRLSFNTSFNGKDKLVTRIAGGNLGTITGNTAAGAEGTQTFNLSPSNNNDNDAKVDWAAYYFPIQAGNNEFNNYIAATGGIHSDYAPTLNPYFEDYDGGNGALSTFASENPIYRIGGGAGVGSTYKFGKNSVSIGYLANNANNPSDGNGLFNGNYALLGQANIGIGDKINLGFTYVNGYSDAATPTFNAGGTSAVVGTRLANGIGRSRETNTYGAEASWKLNDKVNLSAFVAYQDVNFQSGAGDEVWTYGGGVAFPDLGKEGNVLGLFAGAQPYLGSAVNVANGALPLHVEAFYKYKLNDNVSVTPGLIWLSNPEQNETNNDEFIGTLRTTFTF